MRKTVSNGNMDKPAQAPVRRVLSVCDRFVSTSEPACSTVTHV